jgi:hypothetical protein
MIWSAPRNAKDYFFVYGRAISGSPFVMPCHYVIYRERRLVVSIGSERVTFAEMKAHQDQLIADPDFDPTFNQLLDATAVTALDLSRDEVKSLATRRIFAAESRRAFLAPNPAIFGIGRMWTAYYELATGHENVTMFYNLAEALKWLGLDSLPR